MAILKGFPPSNTIQVDPVRNFTCDICGGTFDANFPLMLSLRINDDFNFGLMPCPACYEADQGCEYWSCGLNKWGDEFSIYSMIRQGYTSEQIYPHYIQRKRDYATKRNLRYRGGRLTCFDVAEEVFREMESSVTHYYFWSNWGRDDDRVPSEMTVWCSKKIKVLLMNTPYFDADDMVYRRERIVREGARDYKHENPEPWEWHLKEIWSVPENFSKFFLEELRR